MYQTNTELSEVGFALIDLDKNGQDELIISDPSKIFIYDLYTISDGKAVHLFFGHEKKAYYLLKNGYIKNEWSESAVMHGDDFYRLNDGILEFVERITFDLYYATNTRLDVNEYEYNCYFISPTDRYEDYKWVTADEAVEKIESYQNANEKLKIEYTLLSDYKN